MELDLNRKFVKAKRPCADGFRWFIKNFAKGGDYQQLLDALVDDNRVSDACWLLDQFGPTDEVRVVDEVDARAMVFAGTLKVMGSVHVDQLIRTGKQLHVQGSVRAGFEGQSGIPAGIICGEDALVTGAVNVKGDLKAQGSIKAGWAVLVQGDLSVRGDFCSGWEIECSGAVEVGGNLKSGRQLLVHENLCCAKSVQVQGTVQVHGQLTVGQGIIAEDDLICGMHLDAGWGILSRGNIEAGGGIRAGEGISARGEIITGEGYGIYAGLAVHQESWPNSAKVMACKRPENLFSGFWCEREEVLS